MSNKATAADSAQQHMTAVARQAMDVSEHLSVAFLSRTLGSGPALRLRVGKPDGPSSEGGKKARLALSLVPTHTPLGAGVMVGWLDVAHSCAELRAYHVVSEQYAERFGSPFSATQPDYDAMLEDIAVLVQERGLLVEVSEERPALPQEPVGLEAPAARATRRTATWPWLLAAALVAGVTTWLALS